MEFYNLKSDYQLDSVLQKSPIFNLELADSIDNEIRKQYELGGNHSLSDISENSIQKEIRSTKVPNKYQDKRTYHMTKGYIDSLIKVASKLSVNIPGQIEHLTLFSMDINAELFSPKCENIDVIIFNKRLLDFCLMMAKIAASTIVLKTENDKTYLDYSSKSMYNTIRTQTEIPIEFATVMYWFCKNQDADTKMFNIADYQSVLAINSIEASEFFVMGHEYSHIYLQHSSIIRNLYKTDKEVLDSTTSKRRIAHRWQNELSADSLAQVLLFKYYQDKVDSISEGKKYINITSGLLFIKCLEILEKSKVIILQKSMEVYSNELRQGVKEFSRTRNLDSLIYDKISLEIIDRDHPPAEYRFNVLLQQFNKMIEVEKLPEEYFHQIALGLALVNALEMIFRVTKPTMLKASILLSNQN